MQGVFMSGWRGGLPHLRLRILYLLCIWNTTLDLFRVLSIFFHAGSSKVCIHGSGVVGRAVLIELIAVCCQGRSVGTACTSPTHHASHTTHPLLIQDTLAHYVSRKGPTGTFHQIHTAPHNHTHLPPTLLRHTDTRHTPTNRTLPDLLHTQV